MGQPRRAGELVERVPARVIRRGRLGVDRDELQIGFGAEREKAVMGAHGRMLSAWCQGQTQPGFEFGGSGGEVGRGQNDMVKG